MLLWRKFDIIRRNIFQNSGLTFNRMIEQYKNAAYSLHFDVASQDT